MFLTNNRSLAPLFLFEGESKAHTWSAFIQIWVFTYVKIPEIVAPDQGTQFDSLR